MYNKTSNDTVLNLKTFKQYTDTILDRVILELEAAGFELEAMGVELGAQGVPVLIDDGVFVDGKIGKN